MAGDTAAGLFAGASMFSAIGGAYTQVEAGRMNRATARFNEAIQRLKARDAQFRGQQAVAKFGMQVKGLKGSQRAAAAARGVDISAGGSVEESLEDTQYWATIDRITMENNIMREAYGFVSASNAERMAGERAISASRVAAASTIVGGISQSASTYYAASR